MEIQLLDFMDPFACISRNKDIQITVGLPIHEDKGVVKHTRYPLQGKDKLGEYQVVRKYNEFKQLRDILLEQYPGFYIPPLPPKKNQISFDFNLNRRHRMLQGFCDRVAEIE